MTITIFPPRESLQELYRKTPKHMFPSMVPHAVVWEGFLNQAQCEAMLDDCLTVDPYEFPGCAAETREIPKGMDRTFQDVTWLVRRVNEEWFNYDIVYEGQAWLQKYTHGTDYQLHRDGVPGQTRKLTAVVMLSQPEEYTGGQLVLNPHPEQFDVPKTLGTIVIFPAWILHHVQEISAGVRFTLNLGFWGPPFK